MSFEIAGKLVKKFEIENKTEKFQAREFVIEIPGNYPEFVKFQLTQERCALVDPYNEGDELKVSFDLRGREWQGKYFTNLNAWRVVAGTATSPNNNEVPMVQASPAVQPTEMVSEPAFNDTAVDDLPF
jgi:single-strand DNA-binding protein